jgi:3,4-dihydroxy-2-butanone 4-phosphate synthase
MAALSDFTPSLKPVAPSAAAACAPVGTPTHAAELSALRARVAEAVRIFREGGAVLVGDDGRRENEADLAFHASFATPENVNAALIHARGLLCVSIGHELADRFAFASAPRLPGDVAHTGFTLAVDARQGIGSGISAHDRALTIRLMADAQATATDFLSPGHVFPVRAHSGGLLARTGHTEALQELCLLAGLAPAAAMCEVLGDDGEALRPATLLPGAQGEAVSTHSTQQARFLGALPYLSTVDLLWNRIFFDTRATIESRFETLSDVSLSLSPTPGHDPYSPRRNTRWSVQRLARGLEERVTCDTLLLLPPGEAFDPARVRVLLSNGITFRDNGVPADKACAEIRIHAACRIEEKIDASVVDFCDLSAKVGLGGTRSSVKRLVSLLRCVDALASRHPTPGGVKALVERMHFAVEGDREFLLAVRG